MEAEKVIHYLLIGNLLSGKVIYEMTNIIDPKTIYEGNLIFTYYQKKKHHPSNIQIDSFTISISVDNLIMIIKTDDLFPIERCFDLFKIIKKSIPNLQELSQDFNINLYKQSLKEKISKIIHDFFNEINNSRKIQNNINYIKNDVNNIIEEESDESNKDSSISSKNSKNYKKSNSLISRTMDVDKFSFNSIKLDKTLYAKKNNSKIFKKEKDNNKKISVKLIDDNEENKTNMYRSLIQSSSLVKIDNNNNDIYKSKIRLNESQMTNKYVNDLKNIVSKITCCKKFIIFIIILVIIIQVVVIPIIIKYSYSY